MASLSLKGVQKIYPNGFHAVKDFNLEIADKEFIIFVGPSGCGKSTTLRMIAGLEDISDGVFKIDGKVMNDVEPKDRDIAMVFQNYALYPHMTVYDNMAFGLKLRKVPKAEIDKKVREAARILDLDKLLDRKPKALSGGAQIAPQSAVSSGVTEDTTLAPSIPCSLRKVENALRKMAAVSIRHKNVFFFILFYLEFYRFCCFTESSFVRFYNISGQFYIICSLCFLKGVFCFFRIGYFFVFTVLFLGKCNAVSFCICYLFPGNSYGFFLFL